jgi:hypothetical protein
MGVAGTRLGNIGGECFLALALVASTAAFAVVTFPFLVARVRNDPMRCARGRFTYWCMLAGYLLGGFATLLGLRDSDRPIMTNAVYGLVAGGYLGSMIGWAVGSRFKRQDEENRV